MVVVVRLAKRCSDTGIRSDTGIPLRKDALTPEFLTPEFLRVLGRQKVQNGPGRMSSIHLVSWGDGSASQAFLGDSRAFTALRDLVASSLGIGGNG